MPIGFFVQGVAVLFEQAPFDPDLQAVLAPLGAFAREGTVQNLHATSWAIPFRPEANGFVLVDVLPRAWPDSMGNQETDTATFLAWGVGAFGPGAWPGGLARASKGSPEKELAAVVERHLGVVRVRVTYALGRAESDQDPLFPEDRDAVAELKAVLKVAEAVLKLPGARAFYNPNAEVITTPASFARSVAAASGKHLPWPLIVAVRSLALSEPRGAWLFDTLGLRSQFDQSRRPLLDHELVLPEGGDPKAAERLLQGLAATAITRGNDWQPGEEVDGPDGAPWSAERHPEALAVPPRPVWRWAPASLRSLE